VVLTSNLSAHRAMSRLCAWAGRMLEESSSGGFTIHFERLNAVICCDQEAASGTSFQNGDATRSFRHPGADGESGRSFRHPSDPAAGPRSPSPLSASPHSPFTPQGKRAGSSLIPKATLPKAFREGGASKGGASKRGASKGRRQSKNEHVSPMGLRESTNAAAKPRGYDVEAARANSELAECAA
jgi:hypothetical protein